MKRTILGAALATSLAAVAITATADVNRAGTFYVSPAFGIYLPDTGREMNNSPIGTLAVGYNFDEHFAVQALFGSMTPANRDTNQSVNGYLAQLEGVFNFSNRTNFVPYAAFGIGESKVTDSQLSTDLGAGFNYYLSPKVSLGLNYRYLMQLNNVQNDNILTLGITFAFGGTETLPAPVAPKAVMQPAQSLTVKQTAMMKEAQSTLRDVLPQGVELCNGTTATPQDGCVTISGNQMTMHLDVKYANNKAVLTGKYAPAADRLVTFLKQYPDVKVTLYGHASAVGTEEYNMRLSQRRAEGVKKYLISRGIAADRISTVGRGFNEPIASNATYEGRALNRRVQADVPVPLKSAQ